MTDPAEFCITTLKSQFRGISNLITIDRRASRPLYQQIYESFRGRIIRGELRAGDLVPSSRELARESHISRLPALTAYAQLLAEGYFESRIGAGTFISSSLPSRPTGASPSAAPGRRMRLKALQYGDAMGLPKLREAIATYLRTSRGVRCEAQQIMIVSGSQQALDLATRVLLEAGRAAWVEEPGYWLVHHVLKAARCRIVPVPVDAEGLNVTAGIKLNRNARAAFVAPSHQYPLGVTMSAARRLQLLEWAQRSRAWIIEDDYDSEYRYGSLPIASLQGLDRNARVIYIGTFSKVMFPSLRLGYLVIPVDLIERFAAMRQVMDICPTHITQAVMSDFIREGHFARHVRRMRPIYAARRRVLVAELERQLGDNVTIMGDQAGMHLAIFLTPGRDDRKIAATAARQSLWLSPLSSSYVGRTPRHGFVLGFGNTKANEIPQAVRHLRKLICQ